MKTTLKRLVALFVFLLLLAPSPCPAEEGGGEDAPPVIKMVKGPDKPTGRYAALPGVQELFKIASEEGQKGFEATRKAYEAYRAKYPNQPVAVYYLADLLLRNGQAEEALKLVKEAQRINPG